MGREGRDGPGDRVDPAREERDLPPLNGPQLCRVLERLGCQKAEAGWAGALTERLLQAILLLRINRESPSRLV